MDNAADLAGACAAAVVPVVQVTEREFQAMVVRDARVLGWRAYHTHDSRRSEAGWPDLALVRDRLVLAELKTDTGRVSAEQQQWLDLLHGAGVETYLWRPRDYDEVLRVLQRRTPRPVNEGANA